MTTDREDTTKWTCDECADVIARPRYVRDYRFCSESCRQAFLAQCGINVPALTNPAT